MMEIIKSYLVHAKNGATELYLLKDGRWVLNKVYPTGSCWTNMPEVISELDANKLINAGFGKNITDEQNS